MEGGTDVPLEILLRKINKSEKITRSLIRLCTRRSTAGSQKTRMFAC